MFIDSVQISDFRKLDGITNLIANDTNLKSILEKFQINDVSFSDLQLPKDLGRIRKIPNIDFRSRLIADLINRDQISLQALYLERNEFFEVAPHLTYFEYAGELPDDYFYQPFGSSLMKLLENCQKIKTLKLTRCSVQYIPNLLLCEKVILENCESMETISSLPNCTEFECTSCPSLWRINDLPLCQKFTLKTCQNLKLLPSLQECKCFDCSTCPIEQIQELPKCKNFYCMMCDLKHLPKALNCEFFSCLYCPVTKLPELNECVFFSCWLCPISVIPPLRKCESFICEYCPLDSLPDLPLCENLFCENCGRVPNQKKRTPNIILDSLFGKSNLD